MSAGRWIGLRSVKERKEGKKGMASFTINGFEIGGGHPLVLIAGPCVIETRDIVFRTADFLKELTFSLEIPLIFKSSYDKANRSSKDSFRGPGLYEGLRILADVKEQFDLPVLSDVHRFEEIDAACEVLDVVQVPAFLCRQTDFVIEVSRKAATVNIKKGQFMAPWDMENVLDKVTSTGCERVILTERGYSFGYNNLVADMRSLPLMRRTGWPVVFDATHSVQLPGGQGRSSGGDREMAVSLARAAVACGVDGLFMEVHPRPDSALCDGPNSLSIDVLPRLLSILKDIDAVVRRDAT